MLINRLYWAARIYFSSYGIAWFSPEAFRAVILYMYRRYDKGWISSKEVSIILGKFRYGASLAEGSSLLRLLRHLDLAVSMKTNRTLYGKLSSKGIEVAKKLKEGKDSRSILHSVFEKWLPLLKLLEYINYRGKVGVNDIVRDLGGEMKYWTKILTLLNIIDKGSIAKPYNSFVVRNFFTPLAQHLNLIYESNRKYSLTPVGKQYLKNLEEIRKQDIVATMPGEYTILAGIADILYDAKTTHIASPWINHELVKIVESIEKLNPQPRQIHLIVRPTTRNKKTIQQLKNTAETTIKTYYYEKLHAKITLNPEGPAIESSANIIQTSLKRNYEIGTYYIKTPQKLTTTIEELQNIAKTFYQ